MGTWEMFIGNNMTSFLVNPEVLLHVHKNSWKFYGKTVEFSKNLGEA